MERDHQRGDIAAYPKTEPLEQEPREPSVQETAAMIATTLGETEQAARHQLQRIVWALGQTAAQALLEQTIQIEEHGGIMLHDGSRRRTPGGVFFHLAYTTGKPKEGRTMRRSLDNKPEKQKQGEKQHQQEQPSNIKAKPVPLQPANILTWDDRRAVVKEAETEKGHATVKITLIGRPGKIVDRGQCIVTVIESTKVPALPKGLPTPTSTPTKYAVYIATKQWSKVKEAIADPEDILIIEGFPKTDPEVTAIAVFATNVTTKKLQMAKKQPRAAQQ